jgi:OFA family oxalate/formate antiporter-like MFS transporter
MQIKSKGYDTVLGGLLIHLVCGSIYLWGNITLYVVSYFHLVGGHDWLDISTAIMVIPISLCVQSSIGPLGAAMQKKYDPRLICGVGSTMIVSAVWLASMATSWYFFVAVYAVLFPAGVGMVYYTPMMCGWEWFPENRGMVSGIIVAGYGFGAVISGFVSTQIVNPNNLKTVSATAGAQPDLFPAEVAT